MKLLRHFNQLGDLSTHFKQKGIFSILLSFIFITCSYFLSVRLGLIFSMSNQISVIWIATGVGIALLRIFGLSFWPSIALGALVSNILTGGPLVTILGITLANTLEAIVGVLLLEFLEKRKVVKGIHAFSFHLILVVMISSFLSATIGVCALFVGNNFPWTTFFSNWTTWFLADFMGGLLFAPLVMVFAIKQEKKSPHYFTLISVLSLGVYLGYYLFFIAKSASLIFLIFPYLLLCSLVFGERGSRLIITICSMLIIYSTRMKTSIFYFGNIDSNFIHFQILLFGISISTLIIHDFKRNATLKSITIILMSGWIGSSLLFYNFYNADYEKKLVNFKDIVHNSVLNIYTQMAMNSTALRSGVGLFMASEKVSREDWFNFSNQLDLQRLGAGIRGFGVVFRVASENISEFEKMHRREGYKDFKVRGIKGFDVKPPDSYVITFLEPQISNLPAVGLDLAVEPNRKFAADLAVDTGDLAITKSITLVQDNTKAEGFLMYYPLYKNGLPHSNIAERRAHSLGWVYAPVRAMDFFSASLGAKYKESLSYRVTEKDTGKILAESTDFKNLINFNQVNTEFKLGNRTFYLQAKPSSFFLWDINTYSSWIGLLAVGATLLLGSFISFIQLEKKRAEELVDERTKQLELSGRMAKLGGWEYHVSKNKFTFSNVVKEIFEMNKYPKIFFNNVEINQAFKQCYNNATSWDFEVEIKTFDNKNIWVRSIGEAKIVDGIIEVIYGTFQDINQHKVLEKQLALERTKSLQSSKLASLGEMSAGIAHEINNPLAIISVSIDLLPKLINDPVKLASRIDSIKKSCERITRIVKALKKFSRSSEKSIYSEHSLNEIIKESLILVESKAKKFMTPVEFEMNTELVILCDEVEIEQVLVNLIHNAIDAVKDQDHRWVKVEAVESRDLIVLRVIDSGLGIPDNVKQKIFEPFFTTKIVGEGTGLGLSITKGILDEHNAMIEIVNLGGNTCFEISFQKIKLHSAA